MEADRSAIHIDADAVILLFPAYAYGPPIIVRDFVRKAVFNTPYCAALVTYGTSPGGALADICRILKKKGIGAIYCGRIPAVENYIAIFGPQSEKTQEKRFAMQKEATDQAVRIIATRATNSISLFHPVSRLISFLFSLGKRVFYSWYRVHDTCTGCGICAEVCPVGAIRIANGRPVFSKKCEHCNGCLAWCPQKSIEFGRLKPEVPHYTHPEIRATEMKRQG